MPHEGDLLKWFQLDAVDGDSLGEDIEYLIAINFVFKGKVVGLISDDLEPNIPQLVPSLKKLADLIDVYFFHRLGGDVVEGLEIYLLAGDEQVPIDMVEGEHSSG